MKRANYDAMLKAKMDLTSALNLIDKRVMAARDRLDAATRELEALIFERTITARAEGRIMTALEDEADAEADLEEKLVATVTRIDQARKGAR